jgi:hypothetical protein
VDSVNVHRRVRSPLTAFSNLVLALLVVACGGDDPVESELSPGADVPDDSALPDTFDECGESLSVLLAAENDDAPRLDAS